jgi:hypothetical protein
MCEQNIGATVSIKAGQGSIIKQTTAWVIGCAMAAGFAANVNANSVTVTDVTDWQTTPVEAVNANLTYLGYNGGVYAGINTLSVNNGTSTSIYSGFCIDPFHWSANGPVSAYQAVPLIDGPKSPATLNAFTTTEIEGLWGEYFSPTMSSSSAAGLQIAIWELVSSNAVANDGLASQYAFALDPGQYDYGASQDIASLSTYDGPTPQLTALTGPGQDYVIDVIGSPPPQPSVPDGQGTFIMLAMTLGVLILARPAIIKSMGQLQKAQAVPINRRSPVFKGRRVDW